MANAKTARKRAKKEALKRAATLAADTFREELSRESISRTLLPVIPVEDDALAPTGTDGDDV